MKKISMFLAILAVAASCSEQDEPLKKGRIHVNLSQQASTGARIAESSEPVAVRISIRNASGDFVEEQTLLDLHSFGSGYVTQSIELLVGTYTITEFFVLDAEGDIIYATPVEFSEKADYVDDPLPVEFVVSEEETTALVLQVVAVDENNTPEQFGYVYFGFVKVTSLNIKITKAYSHPDLSAIDCQFTVKAKNEQDSVVWEKVWNFNSPDSIFENIGIPEGYAQYSFTASQDDHISHTQHIKGDEISTIGQMAFELLHPDLVNDYIITKDEIKIGTLYLPKDKCKLYGRFDFEERIQEDVDYLYIDKAAFDIGGNQLAEIEYSECYGFCNTTINLFNNKPFNEADDYCSVIDLTGSLAETIDDVVIDSYFIIEYKGVYLDLYVFWEYTNSSGRKSGLNQEDIKLRLNRIK